MAKTSVKGSGTKQSPWQLTTPSGSSEYLMYKDESLDPPAIVCLVGKTELRYDLRAIDDLVGDLTLAVAVRRQCTEHPCDDAHAPALPVSKPDYSISKV